MKKRNIEDEDDKLKDSFWVLIGSKVLKSELYIVFSNFICMVLFLEKEPKYPIIKFFVALTLFIILVTGFVQVIEARKANEIASNSLDLSNKMAAYSVLSNSKTSPGAFSKFFNILSSIENNLRLDIVDRELFSGDILELYEGESVLNVSGSKVLFDVYNLVSLILYSNASELEVSFDGTDFAGFVLKDSELVFNKKCRDGSYYDCDNNVTFFEINYVGEGNVLAKDVANSIIKLDSVIDVCEKNDFCLNSGSDSGYEGSYFFVGDEFVGKKVFTLMRGEKTLVRSRFILSDAFAPDVYIFNKTKRSVFNNEYNQFSNGNYNYKMIFSGSEMIFNSLDVEAVVFDLRHSKLSIEYLKSEELNEILNFDYFENGWESCYGEYEMIHDNYAYRKPEGSAGEGDCVVGSQMDKSYFLKIIYRFFGESVLHLFFDGYFHNDKYMHYVDDFYRGDSLRKRYDEKLEENKEIIDSEIMVSSDSMLRIKGYNINGSSIVVDKGFSDIYILDSVFDDESLITFDFSSEIESDEKFCERIKSLFREKEKLKGTFIRKLNVNFIPKGICVLSDGFF